MKQMAMSGFFRQHTRLAEIRPKPVNVSMKWHVAAMRHFYGETFFLTPVFNKLEESLQIFVSI